MTLTGSRVLERYGASLLRSAGFAEGITTDVGQYVSRALTLAGEPARLTALRQTLSAAMRGSPVCDARRFAATLEDAYDAMWQERGESPALA